MPNTINIYATGREASLKTANIAHYEKLCRPYLPLAIQIHKPAGTTASPVAYVRKSEEATLSKRIPALAITVALSEEGRIMTSTQFAAWLNKLLITAKPIAFCIGGAYGFSEEFKKRCDQVISLSPLTFPHALALEILTEQIYRASTILNNHPYHK